jgi:hypothetical protein
MWFDIWFICVLFSGIGNQSGATPLSPQLVNQGLCINMTGTARFHNRDLVRILSWNGHEWNQVHWCFLQFSHVCLKGRSFSFKSTLMCGYVKFFSMEKTHSSVSSVHSTLYWPLFPTLWYYLSRFLFSDVTITDIYLYLQYRLNNLFWTFMKVIKFRAWMIVI